MFGLKVRISESKARVIEQIGRRVAKSEEGGRGKTSKIAEERTRATMSERG